MPNETMAKRIEKLEAVLDKIRLISGRSYKLPVTSVAAMNNMRIINRKCKQALFFSKSQSLKGRKSRLTYGKVKSNS